MKNIIEYSAVMLALILSLIILGVACTAAKPSISFNPSFFIFTATEGADNPPSQAVAIWNSGGG